MFLPIEQGKQGKESGGFPLKDTLTQSHYYRTARATFGGKSHLLNAVTVRVRPHTLELKSSKF